MARELKLRAWHQLRKEMWDCDDLILGRCYLAPSGVGFVRLTGDGCTEQMKALIPLQFTGLLDKNSIEIYEGDILENDNGVKYLVVWEEMLGGFYLSIPNSQRGKEIISCAASKAANEPMLLFKESVIGNIYQNPELLK